MVQGMYTRRKKVPRIPGYKTLIDRYAETALEIRELNKEKALLKEQLLIKMQQVNFETFEALDEEPDLIFDLTGRNYMITISSQDRSTVITDMRKVRKKLSAKDFWENITISITTLRELLTPKQLESSTTIVRGSRKWNVEALPKK